MKSRTQRISIGSTLFILMLVAAVAIIRPLYIRTGEALSSLEKQLVEKAESLTGLSVSYQSLSPSILSAINIKGIVVSDTSSGKKLAEIKRVTVAYNFLDFFSKTPAYAIRSVTINGVTFEYDLVEDRELTQKWIALAKSRTKKELDERKKFDLSALNIDLPFVVQLKNVAVHYSDTWNDAVGTVRSLTLRNNFNATGIAVKGSGRASYRNTYITHNDRRTLMAVQFDVTGTLVPELDGSSATVRFTNAGGADVTVSHLDALVNYENNRFEIRSMRSVLPFSLFMVGDLTEKSFTLAGEFDRFEPFQLVRIRRGPAYFQLFEGTKISGTGNVRVAKQDGVHYAVDFETDWTKRLLGHPFHGSIDLDGTARNVYGHRIVASGDKIQADFSGDFAIKTKQLSGLLSCEKYTLPNGNEISGEVFIDPLDIGFMLVAPKVFLGEERSLTAVQVSVIPENQSVDFSVEFDDYAHADYEESGHVRVDGSYIGGADRYVQARGEVSNVFLDSALMIGAFFAPKKHAATLERLAPHFEPYITTDEVYFSSDFTDFSFNAAPVCLVANTTNDRELLWFAVDGSNQTMQISRFDLQFGALSTNATASADFSNGFDNFTFFGDFTVNAVPYTFSGTYAEHWLNVVGDYAFTASVAFDESVNGSVGFVSLPVPLGKIIPSMSAEASFRYRSVDDFSLDLFRFELEDTSGSFAGNPKLALSGTVSQYGFLADSIGYSDAISALDGQGSMLWNINDRIFDSVHLSLQVESPISAEKLSLSADFTNPSQLPFSSAALKNDFYFTAQAEADAFPVARFLSDQSADNVVSATASASGTISNPFVSLDVRNFGMSLYGSSLVAHGSFVLDDSGVNAENVGATWSNFRMSEGSLSFNPNDFSGAATLRVEGYVLNEPFSMPLALTLSSAPPVQKWRIPPNFTAMLKVGDVTGSLFPQPIAFGLTLMHVPGRYDVFSESSGGLVATVLEDGTITARLGNAAPVQFGASGVITKDAINVELSNVTAQFSELAARFKMPFITLTDGTIKGNIRIAGLPADPEFTGALSVEQPEFTIPSVSKARFRANRVLAAISQSGLSVPQTRFTSGKGDVLVDAHMDFNRWRVGVLDLNLITPINSFVPVDMTLPLIHYKGEAGLDLNLTLEGRDLGVSGLIEAHNADVEIVVSSLQDTLSGNDLFSLFSSKGENIGDSPPRQEDSTPLAIKADLDLLVGQHVQILFNPLLRGAVAPNTPLSLYFDSEGGNFNLKGDVALRGGQIMWLNRNFYMKEGRIVFNESQDLIDPRLTVRAETRERDSGGNPVTITLSALNQPVSSLNPQFSASPAKSELEIMELLGQVISADSENATSLFLAGGDYLVQSVVMRNIENALRELLKFDIFSVRTNVLQNAVKQSIDNTSTGKEIKFSNFFDNSTVYIGKYFGSSIYADAMLHWTYDETKTEEMGSVGGLVFQPEIGLEMASPFVNIRLGVAPDIEAIQNNMWIPSTSITLSWKIAF